MTKILFKFLQGQLGELQDELNEALKLLGDYVFYIEKQFGFTNPSSFIHSLNNAVLYFSIFILFFLLIKTGTEIYLLESNGDATVDAGKIFQRLIESVLLAMIFPQIYDIAVKIANEFLSVILKILGSYNTHFALPAIQTGNSFIRLVFHIYFIILLFILMFKFVKKGIELLILRIGFPLACVSRVRSDKGMFPSYTNMFVKGFLTIILQLSLLSLSINLVSSDTGGLMKLFIAIAIANSAIAVPQFLNQFVISNQGSGGLLSKVFHTSSIFRMIKRR